MDRTSGDDGDFRALIGEVRPLPRGGNRADPGPSRRLPSEAQLARRRRAVEDIDGRDALSDEFVDLIPPFDPLAYRRDGIQQGVVDRLRHGGYPVQDRLVLLRRPLEACRRALPPFIREAREHGLRSVLIVHGRGREIDSAPNVLRSYLARWLTQLDEVQAYVSAQAADGGLGATWVMLRKSERSRAANREHQQKRRG
jgi:DNA-nicking Smr family endonuclease